MTSDAARVLVIEDEPPIRRFLRITLESHGYRFVEAETAAQGLRLAVSEPPDAVVLDLGLP
ncbi:MAG TPA: response regulator, partial [Pirellulales bacterium]